MFKNVASQTVTLSVFDSATGTQKTGDSANLLFYVDKDDGGPVAIASNSGVPTEISSTNSKGDYKIALSQTETNADKLHFTGKSSTSGIVVVSKTIYTTPANFTSLNIANNAVDANVTRLLGTAWLTPAVAGTPDVNAKQLGGTAQTAKDLGAINVTNLNTLSGHDPGATLGTSTLTQAQVTGGAYALNSASFAFNSSLDFSATQKTSLNAATPSVTVSDKTGFSLAAGSLVTATFAAGATVPRVTLVDTCTTNTDMRGTDSAALAATWTATLASHLDAIYGKLPANAIADETLVIAATDAILTAVGAPMQAGSHVQLATTQDQYAPAKAGDAMALTSPYDAAKTAAQAGDAMALTSAYDFAKGTVAVTESYAANGAAPTPVQAMMAIHQMLMGFAISGVNYTVKKLDNTTTAFVVTLSDATSPTGATRT